MCVYANGLTRKRCRYHAAYAGRTGVALAAYDGVVTTSRLHVYLYGYVPYGLYEYAKETRMAMPCRNQSVEHEQIP